MESTKMWWQSKTVWSSIVVVGISLLSIFGLDLSSEQDAVVEVVVQMVTAIAGVIAIIGRVKAKAVIKSGDGKLPIILLIGSMMFGGCGGVRLSAQYKQELQNATAIVTELNTRCQAGDEQACQAGLQEAAYTLELLLDAANGVKSQGREISDERTN